MGQEYGRPCAENNVSVRCPDPVRRVSSPGHGLSRVESHQPRAEHLLQPHFQLSPQCYFRHHIKDILSLSDAFARQSGVYFRLSRPRHSLQQGRNPFPECFLNLHEGFVLRRRKHYPVVRHRHRIAFFRHQPLKFLKFCLGGCNLFSDFPFLRQLFPQFSQFLLEQ